MGERAFSKLQWGLEGTPGTAVPADTMLLSAPISVEPDRTPQYSQDLIGVRSRSVRSFIYEYLVQNSLSFDNEHPPYFQILPMLFSCGLKGSVTPVEQNSGQADYLWGFTPDLTALNAPESITLEVGDDTQAYETEFLMFERFRISGDIAQDGVGSPVNIEADFFGRQWTPTTFTGAISVPTVENMAAKVASFFLDTTWAGVGGTQKTGLLRSYDVEILTGIHPKFTGDADKYFNTYGESYPEFMANFVFEGNADADAIWDAFNSQALQVVQLKLEGSQIGTGDKHSLVLDLGGTWESVVPLSDEDRGNNLHSAILHHKYDGTGAKVLQVNVTTDINVI